jgi:hypothetical protein
LRELRGGYTPLRNALASFGADSVTPLPGVLFDRRARKWKVRLRCGGLNLYGGFHGSLDAANATALKLYALYEIKEASR